MPLNIETKAEYSLKSELMNKMQYKSFVEIFDLNWSIKDICENKYLFLE